MSPTNRVEDRRLADLARDYDAHGVAVLPSAFSSDEVEAWRRECDRLARGIVEVDPDDTRVQSRRHGSGGTVRDRYDPVTEFSPLFRELTSDARLLAIAGAVLGGAAIRFKDRLILKASGTAGYGLHRDWPYWAFLGIPPDEMVSLMLSVDATDATNGALEVFEGLHRTDLPVDPAEPRDLDPRGVEGRTPRVVETAAGDVLLLHPMAPHRSGANRSGGSRRILTIVYTRSENPDAGDRYYAAQAPRG